MLMCSKYFKSWNKMGPYQTFNIAASQCVLMLSASVIFRGWITCVDWLSLHPWCCLAAAEMSPSRGRDSNWLNLPGKLRARPKAPSNYLTAAESGAELRSGCSHDSHFGVKKRKRGKDGIYWAWLSLTQHDLNSSNKMPVFCLITVGLGIHG